ncbi:hypothetical protein M422DRAFT_783466 [Sphaerobolus stellatus SS14]|uniref:Carbohydrate-binding module family 19 domain-containing protein n=1 Tax=Sphaerobolus stellatus (strain SS14) TaxID=990650 RepID=A0A0C9TQD2_SPHS4|nr:hypothetical protein M422DRAFT_783466 [Sphaerobolus stellatus SS14]
MSACAAPTPDGGEFTLQNGEDAISLNNSFNGLATDSPCTEGATACVNQQFAQCVGGQFALTPCAASTVCAALPLVNKPGTSVTCTTPADRDARIAATGAQPAPAKRAAFTQQNGLDAQALNRQFQSLTADSPCTSGQNACVGTQFAQCTNGKFVPFDCAATLMCAALPLVNSPGTSITCVDMPQALQRMQDAGVSASLT